MLGEEVLEVAGGLAFDLCLKAYCPSAEREASLTINPSVSGAALELRLCEEFGLTGPLWLALVVSGSLERPGSLQVIDTQFSLDQFASSFESLLVLMEPAQLTAEGSTCARVSVPVQPAESAVVVDLPCAANHTMADCAKAVAFSLGLLSSSADLDSAGISLHSASEGMLDQQRTIASVSDGADTVDLVVEVEVGSVAMEAIEKHITKLRWEIMDDC